MPDLAVEATGLTLREGDRLALSGVGIRVERGSLYALAGPAGAGKTTALRILAGLTRTTAGEAVVLGRKVPDRRLRSRVGYMPPESGLYPDLTVRENIELYTELHGLADADVGVREAWLTEILDLVAWRAVRARRLPRPVARRVSLALAVIHQPELLLLDDPSEGDPELREVCWGLAARLRSAGTTVVLATRDLEEASHCDRVGLVRRGSPLGEGTPDELARKAGGGDLRDAYLALAKKAEGP